MFEDFLRRILAIGETYTKSSRWILAELDVILAEVRVADLTEAQREALISKIHNYALDVC